MTDLNNSSRILCDIYKGSKKQEMYLYVPKSDGLDNVPEALLARFGEMTLVTTLVLTETRKLARADIIKVMAEIQDRGFYLQMPPTLYPAADQPPSAINRYG